MSTSSSLVLSLSGGTDTLAATESNVAADDNATPDTATPAAASIDHGTAASLGSVTLPTLTTATSQSDEITLVVNTGSGTVVTGTLDAELSTVTGGPACTVTGTLAAA